MTPDNLSAEAASVPDETEPVREPSAWRAALPAAFASVVLAVAAFGVYWPALAGDFVNYDDNVYVYDNPHVQAGFTWDGIRWAFANVETVNWYPLSWLSFEADSSLWGVARPFGFHLTNNVLHAVNTLLLFWVLTRMTGRPWRSAFVAGLFALHPLHVESVAWVSERKDVLSGLFWMLTMAAYVHYAERPHWIRYLLVLLAFALGLMAKSMLVTLPGVLLLLDYWPLRRIRGFLPRRPADGEEFDARPAPVAWWYILAEKVPMLALAAASAAITVYAQQKGGEENPLGEMPTRVGNALLFYGTYLGKTFWPAGLVPFYPYPPESQFSRFAAAEAGLLLAGVTVLALALLRRRPYLAVGWFWFLGTLLPVIGIVQVIGGQGVADRYTYTPLIGVFIAAVWAVADAAGRAGVRPWATGLAGALVLAGFACGTWQQVGYWRNSLTLWEHTLEVDPRNRLANNNKAHYLFTKGDMKGAEEFYSKAIECAPDWDLPHYSLGCTYAQEGKTELAIAEYKEAARLNPRDANMQYVLGWTLLNRTRVAEAIPHLEAAVEVNPSYAAAHTDLGWALYLQGKDTEAIAHYHKALEIGPDSAVVHNYLGQAVLARGDVQGAVDQYEAALRLNPDYGAAHSNLAAALYRQGKVLEAAHQSAEAARLGQ